MKIRSALAVATLLLVSGSANAAPMLAGWDFSQWSAGQNVFAGIPGRQSVLKSNYSDLDTVEVQTTGDLFMGLGYASDFGNLYINGQYGSYATPTSGALPLRATTGNIDLNTNGSTGPSNSVLLMGDGSSGLILLNAEGPPASQTAFQTVRFGAGTAPTGFTGTLDAVFAVDLGAITANGIAMSFAGRTNSSTSVLNVQWSLDGSSYTNLDAFNLGTTPQVYTTTALNLPNAVSEVFFRLQFNGNNSIFPAVDNVQIRAESVVVPEPGTALLLVSGLAGLAAMGRKRA